MSFEVVRVQTGRDSWELGFPLYIYVRLMRLLLLSNRGGACFLCGTGRGELLGCTGRDGEMFEF